MHLAPSSRAAAKRLTSSLQRARPQALARTGPAAHRSYSATPADPVSPPPKGNSSGAPLAFALGAALSGGLAYYLAASGRDGASARNRAGADLNSQYGSPEDFKQAIAELRQVFADADAVTTDVEDLEEHGFSENDYHPSEPARMMRCMGTDGH